MKRIPSLILALAACSPALAQTSVGVSIGIHQPGVYGRIDIGNFPPPPVVYPQPVIIAPGPVAVYQRPIYLHVPPGHAKDWAKHCRQYAACGQPVYFVQERWVQEHYRRDPRHERRDDRSEYRDDRRGPRDRDDHRDRGADRGKGRGDGNGKGRGRD